MTSVKLKKPTNAQLRVLRNLASGRSAAAHCRSMSDYGGLTGTLVALRRRGWLDGEDLTETGWVAAGLANKAVA